MHEEETELLEQIRDKAITGEVSVRNKIAISNEELNVTGKFYPETQNVSGEVKANIDLTAEQIGKEVAKNVKIPETKIPKEYKISEIEKAVEIDGVVNTLPVQTNPDVYQVTRLSNGEEFLDLGKQLEELTEVVGRIPIGNGAGGAGDGGGGFIDEPYDEIQATYPTATTENYEYSFGGVKFADVLVTYSDDTKADLVSVIRTKV